MDYYRWLSQMSKALILWHNIPPLSDHSLYRLLYDRGMQPDQAANYLDRMMAVDDQDEDPS